MKAQSNIFDEIIVDNFAGGGGASTGIELATGRIVDIAINHDPDAILMHKTNHPHTEHLQASVWDVDPVEVCRGRPVGLAWFSPDCKHFSKAKGGKPVDKNIRGLAWVAIRWAAKVKPRVIILENVEEFQTWGPLKVLRDSKTGRVCKMEDYIDEDGEPDIRMVVAKRREVVPFPEQIMVPDKSKAGQTFKQFTTALKNLGYEIDHRELIAADFGAPTIRKRFFLIARCDGKPIVWPEPTHSKTGTDGKPKWRSAAEIIDWSLPCPSIFESKANIKAAYGVDSVRPLADNTLKRVIRGVDKFTIKSGVPYIVPIGYGERNGQAPRVHSIEEPLPTVVADGKHYLANPNMAPFMVQCNHSGGDRVQDASEPMPTITGKHGYGVAAPQIAPFTMHNNTNAAGTDTREPVNTITSGGQQMFITPSLMAIGQTGGGDRIRGADEPINTQVSKAETCLIAPNLIQYHSEQTENVRGQAITEPIMTVDGSNRYGLAIAQLTEYFGNGQPIDVAQPLHTVTAKDREGLTAAQLTQYFGGDNHSQGADAPINTLTTVDREALISAHMQKYFSGGYTGCGSEASNPIGTVTAADHNALATTHISKFYKTGIGQTPNEPLATVTTSTGHLGLVHTTVEKYAADANLKNWPEIRGLLNRYCDYTLADDEVLLIWITGIAYFIADIGLRMLTPKELYSATGFPVDYIIDRDYLGNEYGKTKQVARCGNAVPPPFATALVRANLPKWCKKQITTMAELEREVAV